MSSEDFGNVKTKAPEIMKLYNSKKGTGGPKAAFGDVQYLNEIIKKARNWTPNKAYMVGGVRIQSFSDYVPRMIFDYVQMIYDLAATKLPAHAYTKEVLFVKQFGLTGIKINMSLIPAIAEDGIAPGLDKNGNYVWAGESFDYDAAMEIQNAEGYTENCGTIAVGVSKEHILKLLRDPNIRMVIPYHKSGLNPIVAHMNKIDAFTDYTTLKTNPGGCQNTIDNKTGSAVKNDFNFNKALHDMRENGSPKAVAKQYLDWCAENNYMPKFAEFSENANYYKLLEDFNLYDKSGKYAPQREVRAVFPTEGSAFGSMKELIKQGLEEDAIIEGKRNEDLPKIVDEVKRTLPKTEAEISEDAVKQATTDLEAGLQYSLPQSDYHYSLPDNKDRLLEMYEAGQITKEQLFEALENKPQRENPASIAKLKPEDASTTPELKKKTGENKGDSESKFYESAMKSSIFDESFKNDIKDDTYIQSYNRITNKETLKKAADMLDEGGQAGVTAWFAKPLDTVSLTDIAMGLILMDRYQRVGDYQSAAAAAQRVRMMGTSSGQQVQIFSILGRFTPEGMVHYAQKELDQAYQKFIDTKAKKWAEKNADKFKLTPEDIEKIRRNTLQATALPEDSRARAILLAEICSLVQNKIPPTFADSIRAWQRIAMLLNVRTNIRNILGNAGMAPVFIASDFFGTFVDKAIARTTGVRTTGNFSTKGSGKAFAKGFYESLDDFRRDVHTRQEELNRFELDGFKGREAPGKNFNAGTRSAVWNKMADILNGLDRFTSFCLEAGDRTFFEMWVNNSLNNQMRLNNVTEPTPEMLLAATEEALQRTWQDNSQMARVVSKLKQTMNIANIGGYGLGDVLVKFTKTPANIAKAIGDFSPAGFIFATKNIVQIRQAFEKGQLTPAMQNKAVKSMSNAITGTLIYLLVTALASAGVIRLSGDSDDDKDVSNFERYIVGIPPYSMEFFGVNITYDWMQPFGSVLAIVSEYMESKKDKSTGWGDDFVQAVMAGGEVFTKQSFLQSLYEFFSNSDENFIMGLSQAVAFDPSVFIPQLISQTASIIDPKRRMTYDNNFWKNSLNQVISKIPGLRMLLPEQVNVMGETIENNQFLNPWLAFVAPYNTYPDSYGKTAEKIYDLYKTTGDKEVIPRSAPKNFSVKGHKYSFTQKQKQEFQRDMGQASAEMLDIFFKSKEYQKLNDAQKVDVIKSIYGYSAKLAKFNVVKNDYDYALLSDIIGYKDEEETQPILTKSKYDSLSQKAKIQIVEEGIFTTKERALKNYNEAVKYFISKTK